MSFILFSKHCGFLRCFFLFNPFLVVSEAFANNQTGLAKCVNDVTYYNSYATTRDLMGRTFVA